MTKLNLDNRLSSMADLVRQGAVFADIGTDHGYLPVFLILEGRVERAVLGDVNAGPLATARATAEDFGVSDRVKLVLTDGLTGLSDEGLTDIAVCGMGGDLIARILSDAPFIKNNGIRLILQPMTRPGVLRRALASLGFEIVSERYSISQGKYYVGFAAEYRGEAREMTLYEAELGLGDFLPSDKDAYIGYLQGRIRAYTGAIDGKSAAGESLGDLPCLKDYAEKLISRAENK